MFTKCDNWAEFVITQKPDFTIKLCKGHFIQALGFLGHFGVKFEVGELDILDQGHMGCEWKELEGDNAR